MTTRWITVSLVALLAACGSTTETGKGAEESPLTDGKEDSFFRPTEHGSLMFGLPNEARLTEDEGFHAWTFELSDEAHVALQTKVSQNLDTVMYLYRRSSPDASWGRYIEKNDDFGDNVASRIELRRAEPGEYRVIVKGFKTALRGPFGLEASCDGAGCPTADQCEAGVVEALPRAAGFGESCTNRIMAVLGSPERSNTSTSVPYADQCAATGMTRRAFEGYVAWWQDVAGIDALGEPDELEFNIEVSTREAGHVLNVDAGGDEDGLTLVFDEAGELLVTFQHNQSPTVDYYCAAANEQTFEGPSPECFSDIMWGMPTGAQPERSESGREMLDTIAAIDIAYVAEATADYAALYARDDVDTQLVEFSVDEFSEVVTVSLFTVADDSTSLWANYTFVPVYDGVRMVRESAWDSTIKCE